LKIEDLWYRFALSLLGFDLHKIAGKV